MNSGHYKSSYRPDNLPMVFRQPAFALVIFVRHLLSLPHLLGLNIESRYLGHRVVSIFLPIHRLFRRQNISALWSDTAFGYEVTPRYYQHYFVLRLSLPSLNLILSSAAEPKPVDSL